MIISPLTLVIVINIPTILNLWHLFPIQVSRRTMMMGMCLDVDISHILIELPYIYSYRKACNFFPNCTLFVAWGTSEITRFPSCHSVHYPIRSSSTLVASVRVLATPLLHWQLLKMAAVRSLALFTARTVSLFLSRRNAMRTEWKHGESDEIMSHGSTSRGVILVLFMAAMWHSLGALAPVLLFWTLGCHLHHHSSIFHPKAFCFTTEQVSTL